MNPRPYQQQAIDAAIRDFDAGADSTLVVLATGLGKTIVFSHIADHFVHRGRIMVLAHRAELIHQAAEKLGKVTGHNPDIEMGSRRADIEGMWKSPVIVSSIQTQDAGRMKRFDPSEFALLIIDEAHHAPADSYRRVINHYRRNPDLKLLGVTATPDRADEKAMSNIFGSCSFQFGIREGIEDGWLAPIASRRIRIKGLDFSGVKTTAGDLNGADLAAVMESEGNLHGIADATIREAGNAKTLVFAASVDQGRSLTEIFNRHREHCARFLCGGTDDQERAQCVRDYAAGRFQFLINVGIATEGFDDPGIGCVAIARPTKSRALYTQMVGRGTRPLPGVVDEGHQFAIDQATSRRDAIAASAKPHVLILDFVGNSGRHKLVSPVDVLAGETITDEVKERAQRLIERGDTANPQEAIRQAQGEIDREAIRRAAAARKAEEEREAKRRAEVVARARYSVDANDPFNVLDVKPPNVPIHMRARKATEKQVAYLRNVGIPNAETMSIIEASSLIETLKSRRERGACTFKQARLLKQLGYGGEFTFEEARQKLDEHFDRVRGRAMA